jgi:PAS domain S-box-containing protein
MRLAKGGRTSFPFAQSLTICWLWDGIVPALVEKIPPLLRGYLGLAAFAAVGVTATLSTAWLSRMADRESLQKDFISRIDLRHAFLRQSLLEYENALFSLRLVGQNNKTLEPREFLHAAAELRKRKPGIYCIQWVPEVASDQLDALVAETRRLIHPDFRVKSRLPGGGFTDQPVPELTGERHAVITYVYPLASNEAALGYDILTGPTRAQLLAAREDPAIALSPPVPLIQGFEGLVLTCYVARREGTSAPPQNSDGYFQLVLHLHDLLEDIWTRSPSYSADFALYDTTHSEALPLYAHLVGENTAPARPLYDEFTTPESVIREFRIGGRAWRAVYRPHETWLQDRQSKTPGLILAAGLLLTALGVAYFRLLLMRTERIRTVVAERTRELSESRSFLDTIINETPSAIWVKDASLRYRLVNDEFCRAHAVSKQEILGGPATRLLTAEQAAQAEGVDRDILARGTNLHYEETIQVGGRTRTYLVAKFPLRQADGTVYAVGGVATDITERRLAETNRAAVEKRLFESQKLESLGVMAGGIAHDFNNLLTGILGQANLCRLQLPARSPQQAGLAQIELAALRAAELCQQMLAYSGRGRFSLAPVELGSLVSDTTPLLSLSLSKRATLRCELAPGLPCVEADVTQLRQIIMNLVMNASEALGSEAGEITVRTKLVSGNAALFAACVHSPELPEGDYVCLEVADTGCGMDAATQARIFDPFFTTKFTGRGLGLAAVLGITRGHRGALGVRSEPGRGSTFRLYLPASTARPALPETPRTPHPDQTAAMTPAGRTILLVDDEEPVREIATAILQNLGYQVRVGHDGTTGLALLQSDPLKPVAAVVDLTMPGITTREFLDAARRIRPDLPILFISGYSEHDAKPLLGEPRTDFLAKPFSVSSLREKLDRLLCG